MKRTIIHVLDINSSLATAMAAVITIEGLQNWWTTEVSGSAAKGGTIKFKFAEVFKPEMKVIKSLKSRVEWECLAGEKEWAGDKFTFAFSSNSSLTKLTFTQEYSNDISEEQYGRFNYNWGYYLHSLKLYCETGKGIPFSVKKKK